MGGWDEGRVGKHSRQRDISAKDLGWEEAGGSLEAER